MSNAYSTTFILSASRLLFTLTLFVTLSTASARAEMNEFELARVAGIEAVKKSLEPLPTSVKKYNELLSGLDTKSIASIVTALDGYKDRFQNATQEERDKAFVFFYLTYLQTAENSYELECSGLDENPDHIPNLRKIAEKAGLDVFDECACLFWGPKQYFLLNTFQDFVSPSLVEFLKLKARDLQFGFMSDGSLTIGFPELGERCVCWETYFYGFPNSLMRVVARAHYERDLQALILGAGYGAYPYDGQEDVASTKIDKEYLSVYQHIMQAHPATPLADLLRKYLDLLSKSDTIKKEKREMFFAQYKALGERKIVCFPINFGESCRSKISWEMVHRGCLAFGAPAVGVVDTESGKVTRVKYGNDGVAYPAKPYEREFIFPCVWSSTSFYTLIATERDNTKGKSQGSGQWVVREFDGQAHLVGTTPISQTFRPVSFDRHYLYRPEMKRVLGPETDSPALNDPPNTVVGGPTEEDVAMLRSIKETEEGWVNACSFASESQQLLFHSENLSRVGVSSDMRFVAAVLNVREKKACELHVIDTKTGENKLLGNVGGYLFGRVPAWSPDSKMMAYPLPESQGHESILTYSVDTGELRKLVPDVCKEEGNASVVLFLDANRLLYNYQKRKSNSGEWIALDIATGKTLWTLRDTMEYVTVFDSGKKIACFFPEAQK